MKTLFFLLAIGISCVFAQCQEVVFADTTEIKQLFSYKFVHLRGHKSNVIGGGGGGIVVLYQFVNKGDKCWKLCYEIDDRCLDECPSKYSYFGGSSIILIHDADENGKPIPNPDCQQTKACIQQVVDGWLFIHPRKDRWMVKTNKDGSTTRINMGQKPIRKEEFITRIIRFKKDGTVVDF